MLLDDVPVLQRQMPILYVDGSVLLRELYEAHSADERHRGRKNSVFGRRERRDVLLSGIRLLRSNTQKIRHCKKRWVYFYAVSKKIAHTTQTDRHTHTHVSH